MEDEESTSKTGKTAEATGQAGGSCPTNRLLSFVRHSIEAIMHLIVRDSRLLWCFVFRVRIEMGR